MPIVCNWNKCKLLFFFRKWCCGFGIESGVRSLDNIFHSWKLCRMHIFSFVSAKGSVDLRLNILWLPLSDNYIHSSFTWKATIAATKQFVTHHSCPELPLGKGRDYNWISDSIRRSYHSVFVLIRTKLRPDDVISVIIPNIHVTFTSLFKCICMKEGTVTCTPRDNNTTLL